MRYNGRCRRSKDVNTPELIGQGVRVRVTMLIWFGLVSLFNGISTFVGYLMPKPFSKKNSSGTI